MAIVDRFGRPLVQDEDVTRTMRRDRWENALTGIGTRADKAVHGRFFPVFRILDQELTSLHNGSDIAAKIVEERPMQMFRRGFEIEAPNVKASEVDDVRQFATDLLEIEDNNREGMIWGRLYGGTLLILDIDDGRMPWEPLDEDNIRSFESISLVDRRYAYVLSQYSNLGSTSKYGRPEVYLISNAIASSGWDGHGKVSKISPEELKRRGADIGMIHETRVIRYDGNRADLVTRQQLAGWNWSVLQRVYDAMRQFEHAFDSVGYLLSDASQAVFKLHGLLKAISAGQRQALSDRILMMEQQRSVMRGIALDAGGPNGENAESFERTPTTFAGVSDILDRMMLRLATAANMPATELFGRAPAGLNATGDADIRKWYDTIAVEQSNFLAPKLTRIFKLLAKSKSGPLKGRDVQWKMHFHPLWAPTDDELADTRLKNAQRDQVYIQEGVVKAEEVAVDLEDVYPNLDVEAREEVLAAGQSFEPYPKDPEQQPNPTPTGSAAIGARNTGEPQSPAAPVPVLKGGGTGGSGGKPAVGVALKPADPRQLTTPAKTDAMPRADGDPEQARESMKYRAARATQRAKRAENKLRALLPDAESAREGGGDDSHPAIAAARAARVLARDRHREADAAQKRASSLSIRSSERDRRAKKAAWHRAAAEQHSKDLGPESDVRAPPSDAREDRKDAGKQVARKVYKQLLEDYPSNAIEWVLAAQWQGPKDVALDRIDMSGRANWKATRDIPTHMEGHVERIENDEAPPVVLVDVPGKGKLVIVDGHHRVLAYDKLGRPARAYVASVGDATGPWTDMHTINQLGSGESSG